MAHRVEYRSIGCNLRRLGALYSGALIISQLVLYGPGLYFKVCASAEASGPVFNIAARQEAAITTLEVGTPIKRRMEPDGVQLYRVSLAAGQYLRVIVDQQGADVVASLLGPNGQRIIRADGITGSTGPEPLSVIAEEPGEYRIEVRLSGKKAPAGYYEIRIAALRSPTGLRSTVRRPGRCTGPTPARCRRSRYRAPSRRGTYREKYFTSSPLVAFFRPDDW